MKFLHSIAVALSLVVTASISISATAFSISSSAVTQQVDGNALARVFTISGSEPLSKLHVGFVGRVFVDADRELMPVTKGESTTLAVRDAVAQVIITSDSRDLLDAVEVIEEPADGIKLQFKDEPLSVQGRVLTEVIVAHKNHVVELTASGSNDVVVGHDVLVQEDTHAALHVAVSGSGDVYVGGDDATLSLKALQLTVNGSGDIQLTTKTLAVADIVSLLVSGSGTSALLCEQIQADKAIESVVSGSGDIFVQSERVLTDTLSSTVHGSGDIVISPSGSCKTQHVAVRGAGEIATGSVSCVDTDVSIYGAGQAVVRSSHALHVRTSSSSGLVRYVGDAPTDIKLDHHLRRGEKLSDYIKQTNGNKYRMYHPRHVPSRTSEHVVVKRSGSQNGWAGFFHWGHDDDDDDDMAVVMDKPWSQSMAAHMRASNSHAWVVVTVVGVAFVGVGVAAHKFQQRRTREAYQPLL